MTTQVAPVQTPIETVTPLRPSEAMRLGRLKYPVELQGPTISGNGACAIGSLMAGMGWDDEGDEASWADSRVWGFLGNDTVQCPARPACFWNTGQTKVPLSRTWAVVHLNDSHGWSTDQIADWLAGIGL